MIRVGNSVHLTPPPFPNALYGKKMKGDALKVFKVLHQVKVNNPHLDMIKQVLVYAKFVKELCTVKRGLNMERKAFLAKHVRIRVIPPSR